MKQAALPTTLENNTHHFEIQWSGDGNNWQSVGRVNSHGSSTATQSYSFNYTGQPAGIYFVITANRQSYKIIKQ